MKLEVSHFNGYPLKVVRDFLYVHRLSHSLNPERTEEIGARVAQRLNIKVRFVDTLLEHGLVHHKKYLDWQKKPKYHLELTELGRRVGAMILIPRMNRATINKLVADVERRAWEVNGDDRFVMQFVMLGLFGSVLNEQAEDFGDLDVVFRLDYKPYWKARLGDRVRADRPYPSRWQAKLEEFHREHFPQDDRWYDEFGDWETSPGVGRRPLQYIKARQGRISLNSESNLEQLEAKNPVPYRLLFGARTAR